MEFKNLILEKKDSVATITLNRPDAMNAMDRALSFDLAAALRDVSEDESVAVVVLKGAGRAFCVGVDLKDPPLGGGPGTDLGFLGIWESIENMDKPVIAAVHGYAVTGGLLLAYCCDIVVASEDAKFADTHAQWGFIPSGGETQRLPRRVGLSKAKELMFLCEYIDAQEAWRIGLVDRVVPREKLDEEVARMTSKIVSNSRKVIRTIKPLLNRGAEVNFATGLRMEAFANKWGTINAEPDADRESRLASFRRGKS